MAILIDSLNSLSESLKQNPISVFALDAKAGNKIGIESIWPNYTIIAALRSLDTPILTSSVNVIELEDHVSPEEWLRVKNHKHKICSVPIIRNRINSYHNPIICTQNNSLSLEKLALENNWQLAINTTATRAFLENKINFRRILNEENIPTPKYKILDTDGIETQTLPAELPFVVQYPFSLAGKGTFIIKSETDWSHFVNQYLALPKPLTQLLISELVAGYPVSMTAITTRWGTFTSQLQLQIINTSNQARYGSFVGHDWSASNQIPAHTHKLATQYMQTISTRIMKHGQRGMFGVDFMWDPNTDQLVALECNPRITGVLPTLDSIQVKAGHMPFLALHLLEYSADFITPKIHLDYETIQSQLILPKSGAHMIVSSPHNYPTTPNKAPQPGIYKLVEENYNFVSASFDLNNLRSDNEFILDQVGVPSYTLMPYERICHVISKGSLLTATLELSELAKVLLKKIPTDFDLHKA